MVETIAGLYIIYTPIQEIDLYTSIYGSLYTIYIRKLHEYGYHIYQPLRSGRIWHKVNS